MAKAFEKKYLAQEAINAVDDNVKALHDVNKGKTAAFLFMIKGNVMAHVPRDRFGYAYELAGLKSVLPAKDSKAPVAPRLEAGSPEVKAAAPALPI